MASALVAEVLLRRMAGREDDIEKMKQLTANAKEFEDVAVGMLKKSFELDDNDTSRLLRRRTTWWGGKSCLQLAIKFHSKVFLTQQACTSLLDEIWFGGISRSKSTFMQLNRNEKEIKGFSMSEIRVKKRPCRKLVFIYDASPVVKYTLNLVMFVTFLLFFSYVLLVDLQPRFTVCQGVLCVWVATFLGEEIRQVIGVQENRLKRKLDEYLRERWNWLDLITILGVAVGMLLSLIDGDTPYLIRRIVLNVTIFLFAMRLLQMFVVKKTLGPMLTMIHRMISDTVSFMIILLVFVLAYGVVSYSIKFPQAAPRWRLLYDVPRQVYWHIYGEFSLDEENCVTSQTSTCKYPASKYIEEVMMAGYVIITHVLLLNILIAKFNFTFAEVHGKSNMIWAWHRCQIIHEYYTRPWLPPPFNVIHLLIWIGRRLGRGVKYQVRQLCRTSCCRRQSNVSRENRSSSVPMLEKGKSAGVSVGRVDVTSVEIVWNWMQQYHYNRYRMNYWINEPGCNTIITATTNPLKSCVLRDLRPGTVYQVEVLGGVEDDLGVSNGWDRIAVLEAETDTDLEWEELSKLETDIVTFYLLALPTSKNTISQRADELSEQLSGIVASHGDSHNLITSSIEQLSDDVVQLKKLQHEQAGQLAAENTENIIHIQDMQDKLKKVENSLEDIRTCQVSILDVLKDIKTKL